MTPTPFHRTAAGLSNMHLFLRINATNVDAIVFVEGGISRSLSDVLSDNFDSESQDIAFWRKCFADLGPDLALEFRAIGSKPTLRSMALLVAEGSATHIYVAMDRDFDNLLGDIIDKPRVLYTFGHSWENDVWNEPAMEESFYTLCGVDRSTTNVQVKAVLSKGFQDFKRDARWITKGDFLCVMHAIDCLPSDKPFKVIKKSTRTSPAAMNKPALLRCIRDAKAKKTAEINTGLKISLEPRVDCCGHVVGAFGYSLLDHLFQRFCKRASRPRDIIDSIMIDKFFERLRLGAFEQVRLHYQNQLAA
jgi:hypothetical protein